MENIKRIVIHCSFTKPRKGRAGSPLIGAKEIKKWHTDPRPEGRGWRDIGYHYVIKRDGTVEKGRADNVQGAHVSGHNKDSLGVCLVGGMGPDGEAVNDYTDEQWYALEVLVGGLVMKHKATVCGHNDLTKSKSCPNFNVKTWWRKVKAA